MPNVSLTISPKIIMFARGHIFCQKNHWTNHQGFLEKMTNFQVCQNHFKTASLSMWTMVIHKRGKIYRLFGLITAKFENVIYHKTSRFIMETSMDKSHISSFWSYKMTKS